MGTSTHNLVITGRATGLTQVQREIRALYSTTTQDIRGLTHSVQRFGHHTFTALAIFKGLAIYRGFGLLTQQMSEGVQAAIQFEKAMANVNSLLLVSDDQLRSYSDYVMQLGQQLPLTVNAIAEGMYDIVSAGITTRREIERVAKLAGTAAVAGVTDLKNAVQAGIGTMNAFGKTIDDLEHIYDVHFMTVKMGILTYEQLNQVMGRVSASAALAGQGMETAFAALVAISRGGFGGVAFAEGSTRVVRFFQELGDPAAQQKIRELGISVYDSFGRMRNAIDIVTDLQKVFATMTEEARNAAINQIFTNIRSAQGFQVLSEQLDIWREAQMKSIIATGAMTAAFDKQKDTVDATITIIGNKFTNLMRSVVEFIAPAIDRLARMFDVMGQNIVPLIVVIGILTSRYIAAAAASKLLAGTEKLRLLQQEMNIVQAHKEALVEDKLRTIRQLNLYSMKDGIIIASEDDAMRLVRIEHIEQEALVMNKVTKEIQTDISALAMHRLRTITATGAILGMTAGFLMMSAGQKEVGAAIIGFTTALHTMSVILPIVTGLVNAKTAATAAGTTATWSAVIAESALSFGTTALLASAGVAAAIGVMTAAMLATSGAADKATTSVGGLTDSVYGLEESMDGSEDAMRDFINNLITTGDTAAVVQQKVRDAAGAFEGFTVSAARMLAESGYVETTSGVALMRAPAFPEKFTEETKELTQVYKDFQTALSKGLGFTDAEIEALYEGNIELILEAQERLLAIENEMVRNEYARVIFGQWIVDLWETAGKKLADASGDVDAIMEKAADETERIAENLRAGIPDTAKRIVVGQPDIAGWIRALNIPTAAGEITPKGLLENMKYYVDIRASDWAKIEDNFSQSMIDTWDITTVGMSDEFADAVLAWELDHDKEYQAWMGAMDQMVLTFEEMASYTTDATAAAAMATKAYAEQWKELGGIMDISDAVERFASHGEALDEAGYYFDGVAGQWDDLGRRWEQIQRQWETLELINTFVSLFSKISEMDLNVPGLKEAAIAGLSKIGESIEPYISSLVYGTTDIFEGLAALLGKPGFWEEAMQSDKVVEVVEATMSEVINAVTSISGLDDFITSLVEAGDTLDAAGFYFGGVAGRWEELGETWARIQKLWMGLQILETIMSIVSNLVDATEMQVQTGTEQVPYQEYTQEALEAQQWLAKNRADYEAVIQSLREKADWYANMGWDQMAEQFDQMADNYQQALDHMIDVSDDMATYYTEQPVYEPILGDGGISDFYQELINALLPILQQMTGSAADSLIEVLRDLLGNLVDPEFWDILAEGVAQSVEEMADEFSQMLRGASGFGDAINAFVEHSQVLESAGYYFKDVAGGWQMLGEEWARIQAYFKVTEMINAFIQSAKAMEEYGVTLPEEFQDNMYALMQLMATQVLPDFQGVIDELIGSIGSEDFWTALADGMAEAQITQSNSIVLAPYIVISERADAEDVVQIVHEALVEEAKRAGFTWGG